MCGACGAGSGRSAPHWSAPFLASVPARSAAARTLTRWSRAAGWSGTVNGVAGGFEIATASGRRSLAPDLAGTLDQLGAHGVRGEQLLAGSGGGVVEGPPSRPGRRPQGSATDPAAPGPAPAGGESSDAGARWVLPSDPRRRYRVPGLLAWVSLAEQTTLLAAMTVHLGLGGPEGIVLTSDGAGGITCDAAPAPVVDVLHGPDEAASVDLVALLCPAFDAR